MGKFQNPTMIGKPNEVVGHTKLSTKLQLVLYNPPYLNRAGKVEVISSGRCYSRGAPAPISH
jgi:hypothetical protein